MTEILEFVQIRTGSNGCANKCRKDRRGHGVMSYVVKNCRGSSSIGNIWAVSIGGYAFHC